MRQSQVECMTNFVKPTILTELCFTVYRSINIQTNNSFRTVLYCLPQHKHSNQQFLQNGALLSTATWTFKPTILTELCFTVYHSTNIQTNNSFRTVLYCLPQHEHSNQQFFQNCALLSTTTWTFKPTILTERCFTVYHSINIQTNNSYRTVLYCLPQHKHSNQQFFQNCALLLLIFCISKNTVVSHLRCSGKYDGSLLVQCHI